MKAKNVSTHRTIKVDPSFGGYQMPVTLRRSLDENNITS